ncbi:MAG: DUF1516 family protein [Liquorilactobacillus hordei]|uniref:DUF1516 domain-containing protein n=2 Tax=Liquorilactobacillus hordei TaxID=468911 RepID=A0A3Q8CYP7_9LACO|nr:DUF1516 family protein [Liquorilactobacillus hordei]AUJ29953.1 hypothetical protein BSQ49_06935 [Liquorilactobacillus hordei]MBZ2404787.1 DUF1516 domain-containing protein [Liquorilactobacillus hordei]QYH52559.1 DUF1516 family protein [Liquorilactobacillus hordei DSM 19519]
MIWLWMHLVTWIVLLIVVFSVVFSKKDVSVAAKMIARICYVVALVSGIMLLGYAWEASPVLAVVKILLAIGLIGFCEIYFSQGHNWRSRTKALLLVTTILVGLLGFILAGGRPF